MNDGDCRPANAPDFIVNLPILRPSLRLYDYSIKLTIFWHADMLTLCSHVWLAVRSAGGVCCQSVLVAHARSASRRRRVHSAACDKCANRPSGRAVSGHHKRPNELEGRGAGWRVWFSLFKMVRPGWCDIIAGHYPAMVDMQPVIWSD